MNGTSHDLKSIFGRAAEIESAAERSAYLDEACGIDSPLRAEVEALLATAERVGSFMGAPAVAHDGAESFSLVSEGPGTMIGPYKLLQQIGEGGFGVVFMAKQSVPLQRTVALKIIKAGMDTRQVIARFEAERQALALMDHPYIARVLDAGTTDTGRPYFVMDLVKGTPITQYCDEHRLAPRQRLELLIQVCQAVQHAHQKGIIHRDLKPTNVLVSECDGKPVPKIIDFGVAKATGKRLTEQTMFTEYGQLIGTLEYMSPEQARFNELDIDTRSDVYSLGVLVYELLTGSTPFGRKQLNEAAFDEMLRVIREEEPPKPSTRLSSSDALPSIAVNRGLEPLKLNRLVQGELDWIVMKCLEKDRNRRYETASELAADIERYLAEEPVRACPPSAAYRFRKYARRNKVALAVVGLVATLLLATVIVLLVTNARIRQASTAKDAALVTAREAVDQMLTRVGDEKLLNVPLASPLRKALLEDALRFYEGFAEQAETDPSVRSELASVHRKISRVQLELGRDEDARKSQERSIQLFQSLVDSNPTEPKYREQLADAHNFLGGMINPYPFTANSEEAEAHLREALRICESLEHDFPDRPQVSAGPLKALGDRQFRRNPADAEQLYRRAIAQLDARVERSSAPTPWQWLEPSLARFSLAAYLDDVGPDYRPEECETLHLQAIEGAKRALALEPESKGIRTSLGKMRKELGDVYDRIGRQDEAITLYREALHDYQFGTSRGPWVVENWNMVREMQVALVGKLQSTGRSNEAREAVEQSCNWSHKTAMLLPDDPALQKQVRETQSQIVDLFRFVGDAKAASELEGSLPASEAVAIGVLPQNDDERLANSLDNLGLALNLQWEIPEAEAMHRKALEIWRKQQGGKHPAMIRSLRLLADALLKQQKYTEVEGVLVEADELEQDHATFESTAADLPAQFSPADLYRRLAWALAASPREPIGNPEHAVRLAKKSVALEPAMGGNWYTLGVAEYRAGNWDSAIRDFEKAMELIGAYASGHFYLSMAHRQLGHEDEARQCYAQAVEIMDAKAPNNLELIRLRAESGQLLGITQGKPSTKPEFSNEQRKDVSEPVSASQSTDDK